MDDNLLWNSGRIYVMDNHRLALWCWWQHLEESPHWSYVHIDRHYDALWQVFDPWPKHSTNDHRRDLKAFREATVQESRDTFQLYRWDTITSALWSLHREDLAEVVFATADEGDKPAIPRAQYVKPWALPAVLRLLAETDRSYQTPCIVDIDVDYFTRNDLDGPFGQVFSDVFITELAAQLHRGLAAGRFGVVTIALSPETTGSWELAERIASLLISPLPDAQEFTAGAP